MLAMTLEMQIRSELYHACEKLGADPKLLAAIGSWGDSLGDAAVLDLLKEWNATERKVPDLTWHPISQPAERDAVVLLRDDTHHSVRIGFFKINGWEIYGKVEREIFKPSRWQRIYF